MKTEILFASAKSSSHTGDTVKTDFVTYTVKGSQMGSRGFLRITTQWTYTNSGNAKTLFVNFGGTDFSTGAPTTTATLRQLTTIHNRNDPKSQVGNASAVGASYATGTGAAITATIDTTVDQVVTVSGTLTNTGETITLESCIIEVCYQ